ncbi:hypothetical protein ACFS07_12895 [Undibacterium arcticum]
MITHTGNFVRGTKPARAAVCTKGLKKMVYGINSIFCLLRRAVYRITSILIFLSDREFVMPAATPKTTRAAPVTHSKKSVAAKAPVAAKPQKPAKATAIAPSPTLKRDAIDAASAKSIAPGVEIPAKKAKVIRDSFTMPEVDYRKLAELKSRCLAAGVSVKKSELLRIGLHLLAALPIARLTAAATALESVKKTGRHAVEKAAKKR